MMTESEASSTSKAEPVHSRVRSHSSSSSSASSTNQDATDFQSFLSNVDQVSTLISQLAAADSRAHMDKLRDDADSFIANFARSQAAEESKRRRKGATEDVVDEDGMRTVFSKCSLNKSSADEEDNEDDEFDYDVAHAAASKGTESEGDSVSSDDRRHRERVMEVMANEWRERGNTYFKAGQYLHAVACYSEGLEAKKDCAALWTNRAQANIKLERFDEALSDCDAAIKVCPDCLKAFVHRGRAYMGLKDFNSAEAALRQAIRIDPKQQKAVKVYLKQVVDARKLHVENRQREHKDAEQQEQQQPDKDLCAESSFDAETSPAAPCKTAKSLSDEATAESPSKAAPVADSTGAVASEYSSAEGAPDAAAATALDCPEIVDDIQDNLNKLRRPAQSVGFYSVGITFLALKLHNATATTAFRTRGGFDLIAADKHAEIGSILVKPQEVLSPKESELHDALFDLFAAACYHNVENQRILCATPAFVPMVFKCVEIPQPHRTKEKALTLLHSLSETEAGRDAIITRFDAARLLGALFCTARETPDPGATFATAVVTFLATERRFKINLREQFTARVVPAFETLVQSEASMIDAVDELSSVVPDIAEQDPRRVNDDDPPVIPSSFAVMAVLATDPVLRSKLSHRPRLWSVCVDLLEKNVIRLSKSPQSTASLNIDRKPYLHKLILHMLGFLINVSQDESQHRLEYAARICFQCCVLLKIQEPKAPSLSMSFLIGVDGFSSAVTAASGESASSSASITSKSTSSPSSRKKSKSDSAFSSSRRQPSSSPRAPEDVLAAVAASPPPAAPPALSHHQPRLVSRSPKAAAGEASTTPLEEEPHESTRGLVLLSLLLPQDDLLVEDFVSRGGIATLVTFIQNGTKNQVKASVKVTAVCAQQCPTARDDIVACKKALASIVLLLKDDDEHVIGNAAHCLSHCIEVPKVPEKLTKTNVIKHLLVLARDAKRAGLQENCAILLAKLAMKEPRHLQRLRELHGIEILHTCMKHIKT